MQSASKCIKADLDPNPWSWNHNQHNFYFGELHIIDTTVTVLRCLTQVYANMQIINYKSCLKSYDVFGHLHMRLYQKKSFLLGLLKILLHYRASLGEEQFCCSWRDCLQQGSGFNSHPDTWGGGGVHFLLSNCDEDNFIMQSQRGFTRKCKVYSAYL